LQKLMRQGKGTLLLFLISLSCLISLHLLNFPEIYAEDLETTPLFKTAPNTGTEQLPALESITAEDISIENIWFDYNKEISIATRHESQISKAPGIVTVITGEEIKNMGFRTFVEILRTIPGFEILKEGDFGAVVPAVRGLATSSSANRVRVMINGHFVNDPIRGGAFTEFDDFPVHNIKKLEIIRGPGSAVYGENAFSAVINIITKDANDIDGVKISSGYGSFNTYEENVLFGEIMGKLEISGMLHYRQTSGFDGEIESDTQTILDNSLSPFGYPAVSEAPGSVNDGRQEYILNMKVTYTDVWFQGWYSNKNLDTFLGPQYALTDKSYIEDNHVFGEVGYKKVFNEVFTIKPKIYYDQIDGNNFHKSLPDGTTIPFDTDGNGSYDRLYTYKDGLIGNGKVAEKIVGTDIPFDYALFDGNILTLGFEYRLINQTNVRFLTNFDPATMEPTDSIRDVSDSYPFIKEATRRIGSVYMQDVWDITDTVNVTLGVRHDQYNDFGGATSPRTGLTWAFMKNASLKLLYGEAFRAPNFVEMFTTNQPAIQGNKNLDPETIKTYEIGLNYRFNKYVSSGINYFYNDIKDLIVLRTLPEVQNTSRYENFGDARAWGIETETRVDISKNNYLFMNYTFQNTEDDDGDELPFIARHKGNFGVNTQQWKYVNTNLSAFVSGKRSREDTDTRDDLSAYALLNLSVIGKNFFRSMEIQGTVFNLLDKDYSDPGTTSIPEDLPRPGRTYFIGLSYQF